MLSFGKRTGRKNYFSSAKYGITAIFLLFAILKFLLFLAILLYDYSKSSATIKESKGLNYVFT